MPRVLFLLNLEILEFFALHHPEKDLDLDPLMLISGHRNLPSCEGETVALIVQFVYAKEIDNYLWDAFCQVCGKVVSGVVLPEAHAFVEGHNHSCKK